MKADVFLFVWEANSKRLMVEFFSDIAPISNGFPRQSLEAQLRAASFKGKRMTALGVAVFHPPPSSFAPRSKHPSVIQYPAGQARLFPISTTDKCKAKWEREQHQHAKMNNNCPN